MKKKEKVDKLQKSMQSEWKKFKLWCEQNGFNYKIPGEYGFMNTKNANIALLINFGKIRLMEYGGRVDAEFEMIGEIELLPEKENETTPIAP